MKHFIFDMGGVLKKSIPVDLITNEPSYNPKLERPILNELESGRLSLQEYVKKYANDFVKKNISYEEYVENYREIGRKFGGSFPDVNKTFDLLEEKGHKIYLLSNLHELAFEELKEKVGTSRFVKMFLSFEMGCIKPEPIIYQKVIKEIGDSPSNMYFFDDKEKNIIAAKNEGMNGFVTTGDHLFEIVSNVLNNM